MPADDHTLSRRHRQIMDVVWAEGEATVRDVSEQVPDPPTTNAIRTMLGQLEAGGHVKKKMRGRAAVYSPRKRRDRAARAALRRVLDVFFGGSLGAAVSSHLADPSTTLSDEEIAKLEELIERKRAGARRKGSSA